MSGEWSLIVDRGALKPLVGTVSSVNCFVVHYAFKFMHSYFMCLVCLVLIAISSLCFTYLLQYSLSTRNVNVPYA